MAPGKRRRIGVESFLDIAAAEDRDAYDEGESEVEEERFELSDDDDIDPPAAQTTLSFEAPEDRQSFVDALCADLTSRYVKPHLISEASNMQQPVTVSSDTQQAIDPSLLRLTPNLQPTPGPSRPTPSPAPLTPSSLLSQQLMPPPISSLRSPSQIRKGKQKETEPESDAQGFYSWAPCIPSVYPQMRAYPSKDTLDIPQVNKIDPWERAHTLGKNADRANLPSVHRDDLRREKKHYSRAVSTRLREYVGDNEWVIVCSGPYRGDVGLAIGLEKDEIDVREDEQLEEITNNKLKYRPAEKRRRDQAREWEQLRAEQRKWVKAISHEAELEPDLQWLEDSSMCARNRFTVLLIPRFPGGRVKPGPQDVIQPFTDETDPFSTHGLFYDKDHTGVAEKQGTDILLWKGGEFTRSGLMRAHYFREQLLLATSIPPKLEDLFRQTNHPDLELAPFPHPSNWSFDEGEEVISAGVNATFKYLQVNARSNRQQLAVVHLRVQLAPKPTNNPYVLYPRPADETLEEQRLREEKERIRRKEEEAINRGEYAVPVRSLLKPHKKDDWVLLMTGRHRGRYGRVLVRHGNTISVVLPEERVLSVCHVNAAKRIPTPMERDARLDIFGEKRELVPVPWVGTEIRVTRGPYCGVIGRVEMVERVEGNLGRRLMIGLWAEVVQKFVLVNHDHILTTSGAQRLKDLQPLTETQSRVYGTTTSMLASREPWLGTRVAITKGRAKGYLGYVRRVDVYYGTETQRDRHVPGKTVAKRQGIRLSVELETHVAVDTGLVVLDYQHVRDVKTGRFLNKAYPVRSGSFYDFQPDLKHLPDIVEELDRLEPPGTPQWSRSEMEIMSRDSTLETHWDPYASVTLPVGTFGPDPTVPSPQSPLANTAETVDPVPDEEPLDPREQIAAAELEAFCLQAFKEAEEEEAAAAGPAHWIVHPSLAGLKIQASGTNFNAVQVKHTGRLLELE
ncbi:hypothetical protein AAF712_001169 [Marasmius tenuissimus]|uniref:KOW domain-containing protein n=1 Tax=Marasmius tenuissimus TaxID=585030 RepID=A0ABR3AE70_9AGAR